MANTIKVKRGTNLSNAGTPAAGELVWNSNTNKLYVGNGSTAATGLTAIGGNIYTAGTNITLNGTEFDVDDAFLKNDANDTTSGTITAAGFTTSGNVTTDDYLQVNSNNATIKRYMSNWSTSSTHDVIYNHYLSNLGDYVYLKASGNSATGHGIAVVADVGFYVGDTNVEEGAMTNSATAPLTDTWAYINGSGNAWFKGSGEFNDKLSIVRDNGVAQTTVLSLKAHTTGDQTASLTADIDFHLWDSNTQLSTPQARIGVIGNSTGNQNAESGGILAFYTNVANYSSPSLTERMRIDEDGDVTFAGNIVVGGHAIGDIDVGSEFVDTDDHLMTSGAIKEKIESYGYVTSSGISHDGSTANGVLTYKDADEATVESNLTFNGSTLTLDGSNDGNRNIEIGSGGSGTAFVDLIASDTYTDYSLRLIRWSGDNATSDLTHRGTGDLRFITSDAANILWLTGGAEKMRMVHSTGNLGIGTNSPTQKLDVAGHAHIEGNIYFGDDSVWQLDDTSWTGGSANQANIMLTGSSGWFGFHGDSSNTVSILADGDIRALGHMRVGNNEGYTQYDAAGNIATVMNQDGSDILFIGDTTHTEQIKIRSANKTGNGYIHCQSDGNIGFNGNATFSSPMTVNYGAVFNEGSHDSDFRVESNGYANAFKVDAGADRVDIGVSHKAEYGMRLDGLNRQGGNASSHHLTSWHNILTYSDNTNMAGAIIINTDITRASARMCSLHVVGYAYGASKAIDFTISFYTYANAAGQDGVNGYAYAASLVDRGTDGFNKYVGVNSSGKIAIAIGDHDSSNKYYYGFKITLDNHLNSTGHSAYNSWTTASSTTDGFGWLDKRSPTHYLNRGMTYDQTYTKIIDPSGNTKAWFGDSGDENNYYNGGQHIFRAANSSEYLRITSGHISNTSGGDFHIRRDTSNDDMIEINASDTRIYGDADERIRIGSTITAYKPFQVNNSLGVTRNAHPDGDATMALNLGGSYGGGIKFNDTAHSGIWVKGNGTEMHFGVGGGSYASPGSEQGLFMMEDNGNFHADADVIAYSTSVGSDIKLKENIKDINYGLNDVLKMRAVQFDWKEKRNKAHDIGVIAQEIEKIIPEVVKEAKTIGGSDDIHKVVDYAKLTSVLIKAVQEQQVQIDELKTKLGD